MTWDGSNTNLYLDGTLVDGPRAKNGSVDETRAPMLGANNNAGTAELFFAGRISHVLQIDRVLTAGEIGDLGTEWSA